TRGTRSISATTARRARPISAARTWGPGPRFFGSRLIDGQRTAFERLAVKKADRFLRLGAVAKFNERETSLPSRLGIDRDKDAGQVSRWREMRANFIFSRVIGKIADK